MPADLTVRDDGKAEMMYVGATPWHGLGQKLEGDPSIEEGIEAAGLDWETELIPVVTEDDRRPCPARALRRSDTRAIMGVVGLQYRELPNKSAFAFFQPFLDAGLASLHTAGSLSGGKKVWVLAKIKRDPIKIVKDDVVEKFVLLSNSHDGTTSVRVGFTPIRVVCANTLALAHGDKASKLIRVRHTKNLDENLTALQDVINVADQEFTATAEQYRRLQRKTINQKDVAKYVRTIFGFLPEEKPMNGQQTRTLAECMRLFEEGKGNNLAGVRGTLWAAFNGVTEYLSWIAGKSQDTRLTSLWFGAYAETNKKALETAMTMSA